MDSSAHDPRGRVLMRIVVLLVGWAGYAMAIGLMEGEAQTPTAAREDVYLAGRDVWYERACQTCHSLFGLGGHLGPDLTDVVERRGAGYVEYMVVEGMPGMPAFDLTERELDELIAYLAAVGTTGDYPPRSLHGPAFGGAQ